MEKKISGKCPAEDRPRNVTVHYEKRIDSDGVIAYYKTLDFDCLIGDAGKCPVNCQCPIWEKAPHKLTN
jgi:hypothetical protein